MVRRTSLNTFNEIKREGLLSDMRLSILKSILYNAPCTASEVFHAGNFKTNQSGRFTELKLLGVIYEVRTRVCSVTNRTAIEWDLTGKLPVKPKKNNKPKNLDKCIDYIIKGMDQRDWISITKQTLIKLQSNVEKKTGK
tara:strand:+ start:6224 stop:6640 length:417 start_codon:yes stop_codon:yes gene_type:complete